MQLSLVCPFRTLVNIDSELGRAETADFERLLKSATARAQVSTGIPFACNVADALSDGFTRYFSLDRDHRAGFTVPLAEVTLSADRLSWVEQHAESNFPSPLPLLLKPVGMWLGIYDNCIAIFRVDCSIDTLLASAQFDAPGSFEEHLTAHAAAIASLLQQEYVEPWLRALVAAAESEREGPFARHPLVRTPKELSLFEDLSRHPFPQWDRALCPLLWAHRVFHFHDIPADERAAMNHLFRHAPADDGAGYLTRWGTTYLLDGAKAERVMAMNVVNQYFYCLLDTVNHSQKRLLRMVIGPTRNPPLAVVARRFDQQQNMISMIENELLDFESSLQDLSAEVFDAIKQAFATDTLNAAIAKRTAMLQQRIDRLTQRRMMGQRRFLAYVFVILGSAQIIQVVQNFFWYAIDASSTTDPFPGVITIARQLSFNLTMNILFLAILIGGAIWAFRGEGRSGGSRS